MTLLVADSSPLIALASTGHLGILVRLAGEVQVTATVYAECTSSIEKPGALAIAEAAGNGLLTRISDPDFLDFAMIPNLDDGEASVIAAAKLAECPVLMDEAIGRSIARHHKIPVIGSCGILLLAKQQKLITEIAPILAQWTAELGYRLSNELVREVLRRADEGS